MTLLRALARPMLASFFVVSGYKAVKNPQALVADAEPLAERIVPLAKKLSPDSISSKIPEDTITLVRVNGMLQLAGGIALASGKGRRVGAALLAASLVPSTLAHHPFWQRSDPEEKTADKAHFLKNVSLLGGVLIAAGDTEGKPSLAWRATAGTQSLAKDGKKAKQKAIKKGRSAVDEAVAEGARVVEAVVKETRKAKKAAAKEAKKAAAAVKDSVEAIVDNIDLGEN